MDFILSPCCFSFLRPLVLLLSFSDPVSITSPPESHNVIDDRERIREASIVLYVCKTEGYPLPTVTWYYNGGPVPSSIGVTVSGNELRISDPQVTHSGVYQCVAKNIHSRGESEETRAWFLQVAGRSKLCACDAFCHFTSFIKNFFACVGL